MQNIVSILKIVLPLIVALGIGFGMLTLIAPNFFEAFPKQLKPLLESGILLSAIVVLALNAFFNGIRSAEQAQAEAASAAAAAEHV